MTDPVAPAPEASPSPEPMTPPTNGSPDPNSTPEAKSEGGNGGEHAPEGGGAPKPEPTPEEVAAAARAVVPEGADKYAINLDDDAKQALGLGDADPLAEALTKWAHENGKPQGWLDDVFEGAAAMAKAGLFDVGFDPAAEMTALGENADGRRREVEVWAESLKERGVIDEGMHGELMSLSPTANGVRLIEAMRQMMGAAGDIPKPTGDGADVGEAAKAKAREMRADPRYGKDREFTRSADDQWKAAWPGSR